MATFTSQSYYGRVITLTITETTVDAVNNRSYIKWSCSASGGHTGWIESSVYAVINGTTVLNTGIYQMYQGGIGSGEFWVNHGSDGKKTISVTFDTAIFYYAPESHGGSMALTNIDRTAPTVSLGNAYSITKDSMKFDASANYECNTWQYTTNGGASWSTFDSDAKTSTTLTLTNLSPNTTYTVYVRAYRTYNGIGGTSGAKSGKTLGASPLGDVSATIGSSKTISWTPYDSSFRHTLTYTFGTVSDTIGTNLTSSVSWTPPTSLASQIPTTDSGTGTLTLSTYSGSTLIGSSTSTLTLSISSSAVPSITSCTISPVNTNTWLVSQGIYVASYSKVRVQTTATPSLGSSIVGYSITGLDTTGTSADWTSSLLSSGSKTLTITVTDRRGKTASTTKTFSVYAYNEPSIPQMSYERGIYSEGEWYPDDTGEDLKVVYSTQHISLNGNNKIDISVKFGNGVIDTLTNSVDVSDRVVYKNSIGSTVAYDLQITVRDKVGNDCVKTIPVPTVNIPWVVDFNKKAVGAGGVPQTANTFESWYKAEFFDNVNLHSSLQWKGILLDGAINLDNITDLGKYYVNQQISFGSVGSSNNFAMYVIQPVRSTSYLTQIVLTYDAHIYLRYGSASGDNWRQWVKII